MHLNSEIYLLCRFINVSFLFSNYFLLIQINSVHFLRTLDAIYISLQKIPDFIKSDWQCWYLLPFISEQWLTFHNFLVPKERYYKNLQELHFILFEKNSSYDLCKKLFCFISFAVDVTFLRLSLQYHTLKYFILFSVGTYFYYC